MFSYDFDGVIGGSSNHGIREGGDAVYNLNIGMIFGEEMWSTNKVSDGSLLVDGR